MSITSFLLLGTLLLSVNASIFRLEFNIEKPSENDKAKFLDKNNEIIP